MPVLVGRRSIPAGAPQRSHSPETTSGSFAADNFRGISVIPEVGMKKLSQLWTKLAHCSLDDGLLLLVIDLGTSFEVCCDDAQGGDNSILNCGIMREEGIQ